MNLYLFMWRIRLVTFGFSWIRFWIWWLRNWYILKLFALFKFLYNIDLLINWI